MKKLLQDIQSKLDNKIKVMTQEDVEDIFELLKDNEEYNSIVGIEASLTAAYDILTDLPQGKTEDEKSVIGIYQGSELFAIVDLIKDYPDKTNIFIGLLLIAKQYQRQSKGSQIIAKLISAFAERGFVSCDIGVIDKNKKALAFWDKNGFCKNGTIYNHKDYNVIMMTKKL